LTEQINLETVEAYLASIILPQSNLLPSPLVVMSDDTPLYDEPGVLEEMEVAQAEERAAKIDGEIINLEEYNSNLITVTFGGAKLTNTYRVNIPRQLMQVGYMYNRLLHTPACALITESELQMNKDFNSENLQGEFLPPLASEDIMIRLSFPKDLPKDIRLSYNYVLNNNSVDYEAGLSKAELSEIAPKVRLVIEAAESSALRGEVINMILGLIEGSEDAMVELYEYAEYVDTAKATLAKNALLNDDERKAVIIFEFIAMIVSYLHPENLVRNIEEMKQGYEEAMSVGEEKDDEKEDAYAELFSDDFASSLNEIIDGYRQENPDTVTITPEATYEERMEYLALPSNLIPLMGGLLKLSDRMNVDHYYSEDWNREEVTEEQYGTRGEYLIILAMLAVQRIHMFGKSLDFGEMETDLGETQEMKILALSLVTEALTGEKDSEYWFLKESLLRAGKGDHESLLQFLIMCMAELPKPQAVHGPFGMVMHWLGHVMIEEDHTREDMLKLFAQLPIISDFVESVYDDADELEEEEDDDDSDDDETSPSQEICFVTRGLLELPFLHRIPNIELAEQATKALTIFAEHCLRKDDKDVKKGTAEWDEAMGIYLNRILTDDH
jgi:hypothetical protein